MDKRIHPEPVPMSKNCNCESFEYIFKTCSIINSVSGLGINTLLLTKNSSFQKSFLFIK